MKFKTMNGEVARIRTKKAINNARQKMGNKLVL